MFTTRFCWAASPTPAAQNSPEKYSVSPPSYRCGKSERPSGLDKVTRIWELVHGCPHPLLRHTGGGDIGRQWAKGLRGLGIPEGDACKTGCGEEPWAHAAAIGVPSRSASGAGTLLLPHSLLCPCCSWLSYELPLLPSSGYFILSSPLHAGALAGGGCHPACCWGTVFPLS